MLDASKAFDRVNYCKLFAALLERDVSPIVLRLLLFMYINQSLRVKYGNTLSDPDFCNEWCKTGRCGIIHCICCIYGWIVRDAAAD